MAETPSIRNGAQPSENVRKNSVLNYESPLLAEAVVKKQDFFAVGAWARSANTNTSRDGQLR